MVFVWFGDLHPGTPESSISGKIKIASVIVVRAFQESNSHRKARHLTWVGHISQFPSRGSAAHTPQLVSGAPSNCWVLSVRCEAF